MCIVAKMGSTSEARMASSAHPNVTILATDISTFLSDVRIFMIMASSRRQSREKVLVESPEWKRGNIGYIDPTDPVKMFHGRQHYLIHWENTSYHPSYIDCTYVHKMEDISKMKRTRYSLNEVLISPEQRVSLEGLQKDRALGRRLFEESSSRRRRIVEGETFELSIDPFADEPPEETGQKRSAKAPPQHGVPAEETGQKRSDKPLPQQSQQPGEKRSTKRPPQEGVRLEAAEKSSRKKSPILQETSTQSGEQISTKRLPQEIGVRLEATEKSSRKGPLKERLKEAQELMEAEERLRKPPALVLQAAQKSSSQVQETSKQSSRRRQFITEEDDEMFSCNVDPFSAELVDRFEAHVENKEAESPIPQETSTQAGEQSSTKRPPQEEGVRLEATEKSSRKGPLNERLNEAQELKEAEKRLCKPPALV